MLLVAIVSGMVVLNGINGVIIGFVGVGISFLYGYSIALRVNNSDQRGFKVKPV